MGLAARVSGMRRASLGRVKRGRGLGRRGRVSRFATCETRARVRPGVGLGDWAFPSAICGLPRSRAFVAPRVFELVVSIFDGGAG